WDSLNAATNKFDVLASFQFGELVAGNFGPPKKSGPGIEARGPGGAGQKWSAPQWREVLAESHRAGWELAHAEFRHNRFDTDEAGQPRASRFYFRADLTNAGREERATLEGDLVVDWTPKAPGAELPAVKRIDASADYLCARFEGLVLFKGSAQGTFDEPGRLVWSANPHLKYAQALTCGDIDGDGDLDVFLGQYKVPYTRGQMPTPYYDANDGYPAYLLLNDGQGNFTDATAAAGLEKKRWRRTYSASFADLDSDGDLDLLVVSDFAGVDLYRNDGRGRFTDVTREWVAEPRAFGMAHALADFN